MLRLPRPLPEAQVAALLVWTEVPEVPMLLAVQGVGLPSPFPMPSMPEVLRRFPFPVISSRLPR